MATAVEIDRDEMVGFLTPLGFMEIKLPRTREMVMAKVVDSTPGHEICLRIYTTIDGNKSRSVGSDAIRSVLVTKVNGDVKIIGSDKRVHRVEGWKKNLSTRIENWRQQLGPACPNCGRATITKRYSADMAGGKWRMTHQGIAFNKHGRLFDGQNRLTAVVASGSTVRLVVFFGAGEEEEMLVLDTGQNRTAVNAAQVKGIRTNTRIITGITQAIRFATSDGTYFKDKITNSEVIALLEKYQERATLIATWFTGKSGVSLDRAPVRAAMLAAMMNGVSDTLLTRFASVYVDRVPATEPGDEAPKLLRHFVVGQASKGKQGNIEGRDLFLRAAQAITYTVAGREIKNLRAPEISPYVMPENVKDDISI